MSFILNSGRFGAAADPGLTLLQGSTLWLDASDDIANAQWKRNKGTGGRSLDARAGSVGSAQVVKGALKLNGVLGNYASTPDSAALDLSGDVELVARIAALDYTPASNMRVISKRDSASGGNYELFVNTNATLGYGSDTGNIGGSTVALPYTDGTACWIKVTYRTSDRRLQFFHAADQTTEPSSWTQLGTDVTHSGSSNPTNTHALCIGGIGASFNPFNGTIYRTIVRNGIGGTTVFDADFTGVSDLATSFTESSSNAATVTINSTTGVDTNDPLYLAHSGTNYLYLPGVDGNSASTPDATALDITGVIDLIARVALTDWTPTAINSVIAKCGSATAGYELNVQTGGQLGFTNFTTHAVTSTVGTGFTDGAERWIRVLVNPTVDAKFYTSTDGTSWTQLGTTVAYAGAIANNTNVLHVGRRDDAAGQLPLSGQVFRAQVWSGDSTSGGTKVFDADFTANTNQSSFTESSSNAATVTINRATSGRKSVMVTRPVWLFGTDDYMEIADNVLLDVGSGEQITALVLLRDWNNDAVNSCFIAKYDAAAFNDGWGYIRNPSNYQGRAYIDSGASSASVNGAAWSAGVLSAGGIIVDRVAETVTAFNGSTVAATSSTSGFGALANASPMRIGRNTSSSTDYANVEIMHVAIFRSALTSTQLGQIAAYLGV